MLRFSMARRLAGTVSVMLTALTLPIAAQAAASSCAAGDLVRDIPRRAARMPKGSKVMNRLLDQSGPERDAAVVRQVLSGNVPDFLRHLTPVSFSGTRPDGDPVQVTICVTPDYLAVGSDRDHVRVPMGLAAAAKVADRLGFVLPTPKMVDEIYDQAQVHLAPRPMTPGSRMSSTPYLLEHDRTLDAQLRRAGGDLTELIAGQKKDIVLTKRLLTHPGRVAIYGWHRGNGRPIQPLSTVHGASYADYSHGVRLVSQTAFVDGKAVPLNRIMRDPHLAGIVSSEGPIPSATRLMASLY